MVRGAGQPELKALAAKRPEVAGFVRSLPVSRLWLVDVDPHHPASVRHLCDDALDSACHIPPSEMDALDEALRNERAIHRVVEARCGERTHHLEVRTTPVADETGRHVLVALRDVTVERQLEEALKETSTALRELALGADVSAEEALQLALNDPLTGLPNRRAFDAALAAACAEGNFALCLTDMDRFKAVNDSLGHAVGDRLLQAVGQRLRNHTRGNDFVGRLAGDEFALILRGLATEDAAQEIVRRILDGFSARLDLGDVDLQAGMTAGVALGAAGDEPAAVYRKADLALHAAKKRERGSMVVHAAGPSHLAEHDDLVLVKEVLGGRPLPVAFDPLVDRLGEVVGHEIAFANGALDALFATAVKFGLAGDLLSAVVRQTAEAVACGTGGSTHFRLPAVALALETLAPRVLREVAGAGVAPSSLALEVPLASLSCDTAADAVQELTAAGVPVILGDWDMSLSAFAHAAGGAFSAVKLDVSAAEPLLVGARTAEVCRSAFRSLYTLSLGVCARNVASDEMARLVFSLGVSAAQGPVTVGRARLTSAA